MIKDKEKNIKKLDKLSKELLYSPMTIYSQVRVILMALELFGDGFTSADIPRTSKNS